ncbi:MAG: M20/M25/M40 family metallo-hydrolase [Saccharolobus sp.]
MKKLVKFGKCSRPNLIGTLGNGSAKLLFNGHYDVVPSEDGWSIDQYSAVIRDGSSDMKSGIASQIFAVEELRRAKLLPPSLQIIQTIVPDEETVGNVNAGMYYLAQKRQLCYLH